MEISKKILCNLLYVIYLCNLNFDKYSNSMLLICAINMLKICYKWQIKHSILSMQIYIIY